MFSPMNAPTSTIELGRGSADEVGNWSLCRARATLWGGGPQDPIDVTRDKHRDLSGLVGELAALKGDATHWLTGPEYANPAAQARSGARRGRGQRSWRPGAGCG